MKVIYTIMVIISLVLPVMGKYVSSYTTAGTVMKVEADEKAVNISIYANDIFCSDPLIPIPLSELDDFVAYLKSVKDKHTEWEKLAVENDVEEMTKIIPTTPEAYPIFIKWKFGEDMHYPATKTMVRAMFIVKDKSYVSALFVGEVVSHKNQFVKYPGPIVILFLSTKDIDSLVAALDKDAITKSNQEEKIKEDLFK